MGNANIYLERIIAILVKAEKSLTRPDYRELLSQIRDHVGDDEDFADEDFEDEETDQ